MNQFWLCLLFVSCFAGNSFAQTRVANTEADFMPGTLPIFVDSLRGEKYGEFPARWDLKSGTVEIMEMEDQPVIGFVTGATIFPLMSTNAYLPSHFTLEFEMYFHNKGNEAYSVEYDNYKMNTTVRNTAIHQGGSLKRSGQLTAREGWRKVSISFNKRAYKVYLDGERLVNVPNVQETPTRLWVSALSHGSSAGRYAVIRNLRLAEGGSPLYERLITDGRFVTNDIQFDYNEAGLKPTSLNVITSVAEMMKTYPELKVSIEGHTDADGSEEYNLDLSRRRCESVKYVLIGLGIAPERLETKGFGESQPIGENNTEPGKARNRRVEFVLLKE